jgi:hypothetical protein
MLGAPLGTWLRQGPALLRTRRVSTSGAAPEAACVVRFSSAQQYL